MLHQLFINLYLMKKNLSRRSFIQRSAIGSIGFAAMYYTTAFPNMKKPGMRFGLVTYQWGKDWDLPTLIANCKKTGLLGVELRTQHAHGVWRPILMLRNVLM